MDEIMMAPLRYSEVWAGVSPVTRASEYRLGDTGQIVAVEAACTMEIGSRRLCEVIPDKRRMCGGTGAAVFPCRRGGLG
jgi:hypothetical protein